MKEVFIPEKYCVLCRKNMKESSFPLGPSALTCYDCMIATRECPYCCKALVRTKWRDPVTQVISPRQDLYCSLCDDYFPEKV